MKRWFLLLGILTLVLAGTGTAWAKGATQATITGPGLTHAAVVKGSGEFGGSSPLARLTDETGLFPALFATEPNPMLTAAPQPRLGAKYTIRWLIPVDASRGSEVTMVVYPNAAGGPVTFTPPGQFIFDNQRIDGGWFVAPTSLRATLAALGIPLAAPARAVAPTHAAVSAARPAPRRQEGSPTIPNTAVAGLGALIAGALALFTRRSWAALGSAR